MKKKFINFGLLLLAVTIASCERGGVYNPDKDKQPEKVSDITVPADFDWQTSKDVSLTFTAPIESAISIYADEKCHNLLATVPVGPRPSAYNLTVAAGAERVYIQYCSADGQTIVKPYSLLATRGAVQLEIILPEDLGKWVVGQGECLVRYPAADWGTIMFEDMWPELGDYDFNDLSAWYKIQLQDITNSISGPSFEIINMGVRLNALGGYLPYQLCLQIDDLLSDEIDDFECRGADDVLVWESKGNDGPAIFSFQWKNKKGSHGGHYYNTEQQYSVSPEELDNNQLNFIIYLKRGVKINRVRHSSFNFFLRKDDGTEIHLKGYKPTAAFQETYDRIVNENPALNRLIPYCTKDNFVWGVKVPTGISHAVETVDFTKAYTRFSTWVKSGGFLSKDWYDSSFRVSDNCIRVN